MKPKDLIYENIKATKINDFVISELEIDLQHINFGLDKNKDYRKKARSSFSKEEIISFFESLDGLELEPDKDDSFDYFFVEKSFFDPPCFFRMIFCIERKKAISSGIITFFKIKEKK